jgi:type IV pilus assembly protein PilB
MKLARSKPHHETVARTPVPVDETPSAPADLNVAPQGSRLGELLVAANLASPYDIVSALEQVKQGGGKRLGQLLIEQGTVTEADIARVLADQQGSSLVDFRELTPDDDAIHLLDEATARRLVAMPIRILGDSVEVAVADPTAAGLARVREALGRPVRPLVATPQEITLAIGNSYRALSAVDSRVQAFEARDSLRRETERLENVTASDDAPVVQVVQLIITQGLRDRASDIHIEPTAERVRVRYRIDGALQEATSLPASIGPALASRIKILGGMNIVERRRPQDGQISMKVDDRDVDIRVSTTAVVGGEKVVMRLLDKSRPAYRLGQLGMREHTVERFETLLHSPYGMVICAGPTGSGKTTTLYASLSELNTADRNIMTIEDPVEYVFPTINQIQINEQAGITFANGLRSILRQDPDVILVGEVRDVDTARIAVQSALTGHFVLSSLHATDAVSALHRLLDMGIEAFLVASAITGVVAQRLVRRTCTYCKQPYEPSPDEIGFLRMIGGDAPEGGFMHGVGCNLCAHTGYLDRLGVHELLTVTDEVREMVIDRASHEDLRKVARTQGMRTLQEEAMFLVGSGVTTLNEVMRSIYVTGA